MRPACLNERATRSFFRENVTTQVQHVLKALHSLAYGKAMGINEEEKPCPEGATQKAFIQSVVLPLQGKWIGFPEPLDCVQG